jgi:hypothetical protein
MCYPVRCPNCGKTGWAGCGQHLDAVMGTVPASQRCTCPPYPATTPTTGVVTPLLSPLTSRSHFKLGAGDHRPYQAARGERTLETTRRSRPGNDEGMRR